MDKQNVDIKVIWQREISKHFEPADHKKITNWLDANSANIEPEAMQQGLNMCLQILDLAPDHDMLMAAICLPSALRQPDNLAKQFNLQDKTESLLQKCLNLTSIDESSLNNSFAQSDRTQKLLRYVLLEIAEDIRAIPIILAKRLQDLTTLKHTSTKLRKQLAESTLAIYTPLANRMGFGRLKWQLEDICLCFTQPEIYKQLREALNLRRNERETLISEYKNKISKLLLADGIQKFDIAGRAKHMMSIYKKMLRKTLPPEQLYDTLAIRILLPSSKDCYQALSTIHKHWQHFKEEFDDYIANPKPNGYQSIHTVIFTPKRRPIEIQLRTYEMHESAEHGAQAHWAYKEGANTPDNSRINSIRQVIHWQQDLNPTLNKNIYVFTPQGNIIELVRGATAVDFAYHIHTQVGHRCRGAKVNNHLIALTQQLRTGDRVEIITAKEDKPSRDWLRPERGYIATSAARQKISHWFRNQTNIENITKGQALWDDIARENHYSAEDLKNLVTRFNLNDKKDIWRKLGSGELNTKTLENKLTAAEPAPEQENIVISKLELTKKTSGIISTNINNILCSYAKCCSPIPGDTINGYITQSKGVSVHRSNCADLQKILLVHPEREISIDWGNSLAKEKFITEIFITAKDRTGVLRDISTCLATEKVNLTSISAQSDHKGGTTIKANIQVANYEVLQKTINILAGVPDVLTVTRNRAANI